MREDLFNRIFETRSRYRQKKNSGLHVWVVCDYLKGTYLKRFISKTTNNLRFLFQFFVEKKISEGYILTPVGTLFH